jgi:hypothetical protein
MEPGTDCKCHCHYPTPDEKSHLDKAEDFADFVIKIKEFIVATATILVVLMMINTAYHLSSNEYHTLDAMEKGIISLGTNALSGPIAAVTIAGIPVDPTFKKPSVILDAPESTPKAKFIGHNIKR